MTAPVLVFPNYKVPFLLEMDVSKYGLSAVLSQKGPDGKYHPVAYMVAGLLSKPENYHSSKLVKMSLSRLFSLVKI